MGLFHYKWSRTAASNSTADANINFSEGQAPSSVNDSARALMASAAGFRDDISGAIVTTGTSTSYAVTSYQIFDSLANMNGQMIAFTPHATNGATVTLNVDGLGAKPLRSAPSTELQAGVLVQGTPYVATYNNSDAAWYLQNFFVNPYIAPIGGMLDFIGSTAPNSAFVFPYGQAISRTTYSALFALVSTTFGIGDGSTTFNVPDLRGRVVAGKDDMGGTSANRIAALVNGDVLGNFGGSETQTLVTANLPAYTPSGSVTTTPASAIVSFNSAANGGTAAFATHSAVGSSANMLGALGLTVNSSFTGSAQGGTSTAFGILQPTLILNKILRVI
jgi:microcystin-dependent protein